MIKRLALSGDIPVLIELRKRQLLDEGMRPVSDIDKQLSDYFASALADGSFVSWVMESDDEIIATSGVCFYALPPNFSNPTGRIAYITNMYTKDDFRRRGIAADLLQSVIGEAVNRGYKVIRLHASELGKSVYKRAGFTESDGYMSLRI